MTDRHYAADQGEDTAPDSPGSMGRREQPSFQDERAFDRPSYHGQGYSGPRGPAERQSHGDYGGYGSNYVGPSSGGAAQNRGKGPKGYTRSDDRIREDVSDRLTEDPSLDASDIEVQVAGGEVTFNGVVANRADKRHAEDLTEGVSGVTHIQNNLRVR